jgi:hypothetical protein
MKQKKTLRFSDSDSGASALQVQESKRCMTKSHGSDRKEKTMSTTTTTTATTNTTTKACECCKLAFEALPEAGNLCPDCQKVTTPANEIPETAPKAKAKRVKKDKSTTTAKALTLATCGQCRAEYKAEAWHTENLCPDCYAIAHPKPPKAEKTAGQTMARAVAGIALAVLITKGTHYAVSVVDPVTGYNYSKVYTLKTHEEALTLAEKMYKNRELDDILDTTPEALDTEATLAGE